MPDMPVASALILMGGESSRMDGVEKASLKVGPRTIIERQLEVLRPRFGEIIMVGKGSAAYRRLGLSVVQDLMSERAALVGIHAGLLAISGERALVLACDMPFVNGAVIDLMLSVAVDFDVVVPRHSKGLEPLHAIYSRSCLPHIEEQLSRGEMRIARFYDRVRVRELSPEEWRAVDPACASRVAGSWMNVNTRRDYELAREMAARGL